MRFTTRVGYDSQRQRRDSNSGPTNYATEYYAPTRDAGGEVVTNGQRMSICSTESASRVTPSIELAGPSSTNLRVLTECDVLTLSKDKASVAD
jgi:hypothetical protein